MIVLFEGFIVLKLGIVCEQKSFYIFLDHVQRIWAGGEFLLLRRLFGTTLENGKVLGAYFQVNVLEELSVFDRQKIREEELHVLELGVGEDIFGETVKLDRFNEFETQFEEPFLGVVLLKVGLVLTKPEEVIPESKRYQRFFRIRRRILRMFSILFFQHVKQVFLKLINIRRDYG